MESNATQGSHSPSTFHHLHFPVLLKQPKAFITVWLEKRHGLEQQKVCASQEKGNK